MRLVGLAAGQARAPGCNDCNGQLVQLVGLLRGLINCIREKVQLVGLERIAGFCCTKKDCAVRRLAALAR